MARSRRLGPGSSTPWRFLLLSLAVLVTGAAGGGYALARRRGEPLQSPDEVETELQEMIAEERARRSERVVI